jgi:hypothetical protein
MKKSNMTSIIKASKNHTPAVPSPALICPGMVLNMALPMERPSEDIMPMKIINEVPFPMPYSVILSPSHITNEEPAVNIITMQIMVKISLAVLSPNTGTMALLQLNITPMA